MNNNGFFGIQPIGGGIFGFNTPSVSPSAGAMTGSIVGATGSAIGSLLQMSAQEDMRNALKQQSDLANTQFDLQLSQIKSNQDIADLSAVQNANQVYAKQLAQQGASGISAQSSAVQNAFQSTIANKNIAEFSNNMTATTQQLNVYMQKASFYNQVREKLKASYTSEFGELIGGLSSVGGAMALALL